MKTIILGVGNPILRDDGVGIHVAEQVRQQISNPDVSVGEAFTGGMNLVDMILGFDKAIIVDAVKIKDCTLGEVRRLLPHELSSVHSNNPHDLSFFEALKLAETFGEQLIPHDIVIIGIVLKESTMVFGEMLSERMAAAVPTAVRMVLEEIRKKITLSIGD